MAIAEINMEQFETEVLQSEKVVVLDFFGPTCRPCKAMLPSLELVNNSYEGKVKVVKINAEKEAGLVQTYEVQGVPTLLLFKQGSLQDRKTGFLQASQIKEWVGKYVD